MFAITVTACKSLPTDGRSPVTYRDTEQAASGGAIDRPPDLPLRLRTLRSPAGLGCRSRALKRRYDASDVRLQRQTQFALSLG